MDGDRPECKFSNKCINCDQKTKCRVLRGAAQRGRTGSLCPAHEMSRQLPPLSGRRRREAGLTTVPARAASGRRGGASGAGAGLPAVGGGSSPETAAAERGRTGGRWLRT